MAFQRIRTASAIVCSITIAACSQIFGSAPVVDDEVIVARVKTCDYSPQRANDYMQIGFANVFAACEAFFVKATKMQQNALAATNTADAGLLAATSIINLTNSTNAALKAVTIAQAGVTLAKTLVNDYTSIYAFGTHLYKVRDLVQQDMEHYVGGVAPPPDTCIAYANVQKLATRCTIANMQALLDSQVAIQSQVKDTAEPQNTNRTRSRTQNNLMILRRVAPSSNGPLPSISTTVVPR